MASLDAEQWTMTPAQREGFSALLRESRAFWQPMGAVFRVRTSIIAGEGTGLVAVYHFYPDAATRSAALDRGRAEAARDPLARAVASGSVPGTLVGRLFLDSVDPAMPIPDEYAVAALIAYEVAPGRPAAAQAAFDAADARQTPLGVVPALWATHYAGAATGRRLRVLGHDSFAAMSAFEARDAGLEQAHPLDAAVADGTLRVVTSSITVPFETV